MASIVVRTAEKDNTAQGGTESKFYRTFELPTSSVMQWGSMRNGRSGGQFKVSPGPTDAGTIYGKKLNEGYVRVSVETITVADTDLTNAVQSYGHNPKEIGAWLEKAYSAALRNGNVSGTHSTGVHPNQPAPPKRFEANRWGGDTEAESPSPDLTASDVVNGLDLLSSEVLETMGLAATDPHAAMVKTVRYREQHAALTHALDKLTSYLDVLDELVDENA